MNFNCLGKVGLSWINWKLRGSTSTLLVHICSKNLITSCYHKYFMDEYQKLAKIPLKNLKVPANLHVQMRLYVVPELGTVSHRSWILTFYITMYVIGQNAHISKDNSKDHQNIYMFLYKGSVCQSEARMSFSLTKSQNMLM